MQQKEVELRGQKWLASYQWDSQGMVLFSIHNAGGDLTQISEEEFDEIERQVKPDE